MLRRLADPVKRNGRMPPKLPDEDDEHDDSTTGESLKTKERSSIAVNVIRRRWTL